MMMAEQMLVVVCGERVRAWTVVKAAREGGGKGEFSLEGGR